MKKPYLLSIEYIRGVSMLGVVAIHIGSQYLTNPTPNLFLLSIYEIASRFSVPIFFFISAFGLFYKIDLAEKFDYIKFLRRRFKAVLIPYLLWSVFYILHDNFFYGSGIPAPSYALEILFFGLAKYQLYFLVILIWFYLLMPLWIKILRVMTVKKFAVLFFAQIIFNHFSSYSVELFEFTNSLPPDSLLKLFLMWRMNYLVLHYVFIFLLGGILAIHSEKFFTWLAEHKKILSAVFFFNADYFGRIFFLLGTDKKFQPARRSQHGSSTFTAGIFVHNCRVNIFVHAVRVREVRKIFERNFRRIGKKFLLHLSFSPARDNLSDVAFRKIKFGNHGSKLDNSLSADNFDFSCNKFNFEKIFSALMKNFIHQHCTGNRSV